jgi:hypothetical protein
MQSLLYPKQHPHQYTFTSRELIKKITKLFEQQINYILTFKINLYLSLESIRT